MNKKAFQTTKVEVGDLYKVSTDDLWSSGESHNGKGCDDFGRTVKSLVNFKQGEIIEIRYAYQWHIRTSDNKYFHILPEKLVEHCMPFGKIKEDIRSMNNHNLKEIIDNQLFDKAVLCVVVD